MANILPLQRYQPKDYRGIVTPKHLYNLYQKKPELISDVINSIYITNFGMSTYDWVNTFPVLEVESESEPYEWMLQGDYEKNYPLYEAQFEDGSAITTTSIGVGRGVTNFCLLFEDDFAAVSNTILGEQEYYHFYIVGKDKVGNLTKYTVQLVTDDTTEEVDPEELLSGRKFSKESNLQTTTFSSLGTEPQYTSPFKMANRPSFLRLRYEVPGSMIRQGKNDPLEFKFKYHGKEASTWTNYQDLVADWTLKSEYARLCVYGRKNWTSNDLVLNKDPNSNFEVVSGSGLFQQVDPANRHYYNNFNIDDYVDYVLDRSIGRVDRRNRRITILTGEFGAKKIHQQIETKTRAWTTVMANPGLFNTVANKDLGTSPVFGYGGQWGQYRSYNGITLDVGILPFMDDEVRFKTKHPTERGVVESHRMLAFDFGGNSEIYRIKIKGQSDLWTYISGLRDPFSAGGRGSARQTSSELDGYIVNRAMWGGMVVKDPTRIIDWQYNYER